MTANVLNIDMELQAIILAAGRGSRLPELTESQPKALLPIANKPMIWYPLHMLEKSGFEQAIVVVLKSHTASIQTALKPHKINIKLSFSEIPDDSDMGTADSLRSISDKLSSDLLVLSCDLICDLPLHLLVDVHRTYNSTVTMLLAQWPDLVKSAAPGSKARKKQEKDIIGLEKNSNKLLFFGSEADYEETVTFRKSFLKLYPHMTLHTKLLDGHIYLFKKCVLEILKEHKSMSSIKCELIPYLVKQQIQQANTVRKSIYNNGDKKADAPVIEDSVDLTELANELSFWPEQQNPFNEDGSDAIKCVAYRMKEGLCLRTNNILTYCEANRLLPLHMSKFVTTQDVVPVHPTVTIPSKKSQVGNNSYVGEFTTLQERVSIKQSNVGKHCVIKENSRLTNCIVMDHVIIEPGCNISGCVIASDSTVDAGSELKECLIGKSQHVVSGSYTNEHFINDGQWMTL